MWPVPRAQGIVANEIEDPKVAHSDLVFPTVRTLGPAVHTPEGDTLYPESPLSAYPTLASAVEREEWERTFGVITAS